MPELLDRDEIETALEALPEWRYDGDALVRTVSVPADSHDALEESVMSVVAELNHQPQVRRDDDEVTFRLWTHTAGGVTAKDVELAARIDQVLSGAGTDQGR